MPCPVAWMAKCGVCVRIPSHKPLTALVDAQPSFHLHFDLADTVCLIPMHFRQRLRTIVQFYHGDAFLLFPVPVTMPCSESGQLPDASAVGDGLDVLNGS